ncbi:cytochrome P450 [Sistotremastrum suecicum HHB10207 ss-3]|uniref:Cytochrome P450 n=1 Tax=Sistotremastrum suecicum HHB10207 ss-3 TaxID=1314776 RepID=A0A166GGW2_9AGAM|nr:cytochrome P450 [Sistotremastrum suecicum HHB10207 ss-3]
MFLCLIRIPILDTTTGLAILSMALIILRGVFHWLRRSKRRFPPGPRGTYFFGGARKEIMGSSFLWLKYSEWAKRYGPIIYYRIGNQPYIILQNAKAATDLLEKRARIYADRPNNIMFDKLVGSTNIMTRTKYRDPRFPKYRKMFHDELGVRGGKAHWAVQEQEARVFLMNLLNDPENFLLHTRSTASAAIMKVTYGYTPSKENDYFVNLIREWMASFVDAGRPGLWLVDTYPFLQYLPRWFPGAEFLAIAEKQKRMNETILSTPINWVKNEMAAGRAAPSFASKYLSQPNLSAEDEDIVRVVSGVMYFAGSDTATFFLAMTMNPLVQKKAQQELDAVLGSERVPTVADKESLPYVKAILKETLRWHPVAPLGLPHRLTEDDEYEHMFIPAGATVQPNIWQIAHDEDTYPNPMTFDPERHLSQDGKHTQPDPMTYVFGFGRRICPGMHFAENALFLTIASTLTIFNIGKVLDEEGREITPEVKFTSGIVSHVEPFECKVFPRSSSAEDLIRSAAFA